MMRKLVFFIIILSLVGPILGQTSYDVEYAQVCLIDSIAPDTVIQFWRFTQANNPGEYSVDMTFDLGSSYTVEGTVLPCCSCLTEATAINGAGGRGIGDIAQANPPPINALLLLSGAVLLALFIPKRKIAVLLILGAPAAVSAQPGTTYDIEHTCICLVDSIAADTVIQFWRFTQSNNPGQYSVDVTFDMGSSYTVEGTVLSCKDYYLGDNPGGSGTANTLTMWTGTSSLGNSSVTQAGQVLSSSFTGAFKLPSGTDAQDPVWSAGMFRYNTTTNGFQGYDGTGERYLPWADSDNWTTQYIPYSDGSKLVTSANLSFNGTRLFAQTAKVNSELYINQDDVGSYALQVTGASRTTGVITSLGGFECDNSTILFTGYNDRIIAADGSISIRRHDGAGSGSVAQNIITYNGNPGSAFAGNMSLNFKSFLTGPTSYRTHGIIRVVAGTSQALPNNTYGGDMQFWAPADSTQTTLDTTLLIKRNGRIYFPRYGEGNITGGTTAYYAAWTSGGKFIEKLPATVFTDLGINKGSVSTSTDGSGDIAVTHNMGATPGQVLITVTGTTPYVCTVHTKGATTFIVRFFDMAGAAVTSTALTFDWLAKT